jgi:hypothetical protein
MAKKRPRAPGPKSDLDEVERALSILEGRHPDQVRVERETHEAVRARHLAEETALAAARARRVRTLLVWGLPLTLGLASLGAAGWWGQRWDSRAKKADALLAPLVAAYVAHGFHTDERATFSPRDRLEQDVEAGQCFVAVGASAGGDDRLEIDRGGPVLQGHGAVGWCACRVEHVKVTSLAPGREGVVGLASIEARLIGGVMAMPFVDPRPNSVASPDDCATEQLDAWLTSQPSTEPADVAWLDGDPRARGLRRDRRGDALPVPTILRLLAGVEPTMPFGIVAPGHAVCALALSEDAGDLLSLRLTGDARPIAKAKGPIAWCDQSGKTVTVWREGKGRVFVLAAPADRVGGMLGLREIAARAGFRDVTAWIGEADLGWSAASVLRAGGVAAADITISAAPVPDARITAAAVGQLEPETRDLETFLCASPLKEGSGSVCAQGVPLAWRGLAGAGQGGIAQGSLPFWMGVYRPFAKNDVLVAELALIALARRLAGDGFEPTLDGVTDLSSGIDVLGLGGDVSFVAVGTLGTPPWIVPFTDEATPWAVGGAPRFVPITPGAHVKLASAPWSKAPASIRHAVVFRKAPEAG